MLSKIPKEENRLIASKHNILLPTNLQIGFQLYQFGFKKKILSHRKHVIIEYKNSNVDQSDQSDQQMKCVETILLKMCKIKQNLIKDRTAKTKSNARETEQRAFFSDTTKCKKHIRNSYFNPLLLCLSQVSLSTQNISTR